MNQKNIYSLGKTIMNIARISILTFIAVFIIHSFVFSRSNDIPLESVKIQVLSPDQKENLVILWDIHDVILQKDFVRITSAIWYDGLKYDVFKNLNIDLIRNITWLIYQKIVHDSTGEEFVFAAHQANNPALAILIKNIANAQKPIEGTVQIIKALKDCGFTHHIGSNIGKSVFEELIQRADLAHIFNNFDLAHSRVVSYNKGQEVIKKPDPRYFTSYLEKNGLEPQYILFIDDRLENVVSARKVGMHAIHFKNPEQLQHDLELLLGITFVQDPDLALSCTPTQVAAPLTDQAFVQLLSRKK